MQLGKSRRRIMSLLTATTLLFSSFAGTAKADQAPVSLGIMTDQLDYKQGDEVTVYVALADVAHTMPDGLINISYSVAFDPTIFDPAPYVVEPGVDWHYRANDSTSYTVGSSVSDSDAFDNNTPLYVVQDGVNKSYEVYSETTALDAETAPIDSNSDLLAFKLKVKDDVPAGTTTTLSIRPDSVSGFYATGDFIDGSDPSTIDLMASMPITIGLSDTHAVAAGKDALGIQYGGQDSANAVTQKLTLPTTLTDDVSVSWASDDTSAITADGTVTRPSNADGDKTVKLTATLSKGTTTDTKEFIVKVLKAGQTDAEAVAQAKSQLSLTYANGDSASSVTQNISGLIASSLNGVNLNWESNKPSVLSVQGDTAVITRPTYAEGDTEVVLKANLEKNSATDSQEFTLLVKAQAPTNEQIVADAKQILEIGYAGVDTASSVTQSLVLPQTINADGKTVDLSWTSNALQVVNNDGTVTRPSNNTGNSQATVTAHLNYAGVTDTKDFVVTVIALPETDAERVAADKAELAITYALGDSAAGVTQNLTLPASGTKGTGITWSSDTPAVIDATGAVTRPTGADATVHLTATLELNGVVDTKEFTVIVLKKPVQAPTLTSLTVENPILTLEANGSGVLVPVTAHYSDDSTADVSTDAAWDIAKSNIAYVNAMGQIKGIAAGTTAASFTYGGQTVHLTVNVTPPPLSSDKTLLSVTVDGYPATIDQQAKTVTIIFPDGYSQTSGTLTFTMDGNSLLYNGNVVEGNPTINLPAPAGSTFTVQAQDSTEAVYSFVTQIPAPNNNEQPTPSITQLTSNPTSLALVAGTSANLPVVTATYSDTSTAVIAPTDIVWSTSVEGIASVANSQLLTSIAGSTVLTATYGGLHVDIPVVITAASSGGSHSSSDSSSSSGSTTTTTPTTPTTPTETKPETDAGTKPSTDIFKSDVVKTDSNVVSNIEQKVKEAKASASSTSLPTDTKGHWAEKTIDTFVKLGVIKGYEDGTAKPDANITRGEFAAIVSRVFNISSSANTDAAFSDVGNHWAAGAITELAKAGVIGGYGDSTFRPDNNISREEMVIILSRIVNLQAITKDTTKGNFSDLNTSYAADVVKNAAQAGIISGKVDGTFDPKANSTRAEALQIILNALNLNPQIKTLLDSLN